MKIKTIVAAVVAVSLLGGVGTAWSVLRPVGDEVDGAIGKIASGEDPFGALLGVLGSESFANLAQTVKDNAVANYEKLEARYGEQIEAAAVELATRIGESGVIEAIAQGTFDALCNQYGINL